MVSLAEVVARYPTVRLATEADNRRILEFFERAPMHTASVDVRYERGPDFFRLLRYQSDRAFVIIGENEHREVRNVATLSLRPGWCDRQPTTIGYLGDLRITPSRTVSRDWRRLFSELISRSSEIDELADCTQWFSVILDSNREARAALQRPNLPRFVPVGPFTMRNVIMWLPLVRRRNGWRAYAARDQDFAPLERFFEVENRSLSFGFRGEFRRRMLRWDGLAASDFVYVADNGGILACAAPWSPAAAKRTVVSRVPALLSLMARGACFLPSPPLRVPQKGQPLQSMYLTHLTFASRLAAEQRPDVFRALLDAVIDRRTEREWHCVSFADFHAWNLGRALRGFIQQSVPITVYEVLAPGRDAVHIRSDRAPAFEMAMV